MKSEDYTKEATVSIASNSVELENKDTLVIRVNGNQSRETVQEIDRICQELIKNLRYKPNVLIDATNTGFPDKSARQEIISQFNRDDYNAQAIFGLNEALRVVALVILGRVLSRDKTRLFKTEKQARAWLAKNPAKKS